jgi:long-chain acyl-CoA synthetase
MLGYHGNPDATAAAICSGGWLHTGDLGTMDARGFVRITGRVKEMIIRGGENLFPVEIENAMLEHAAIAEAAVVGIPDETWGETVHAIVVPRANCDVTADAVIAHCRNHIAGYKTPRSVEIRATPLPLSAAGKILKTELRAPFWRDKDRGVN